MTFQIDIKHDLRELKQTLTRIEKENLPYATALALNESMKAAQPAVVAEMQRVFDRPTRWTLGSYRILKWANKRALFGIVGFKDEAVKGTPAGEYLQPQMAGGPRAPKRLERLLRTRGLLGNNEFLVPSKFQKLDSHGNVSRGTIQKILSNLQATFDPYQRTPTGGAREGKKKGEYFFTRKGIRGARHTMIWRRYSAARAVPAFIVVASAPKYRKRFDQPAVVQRVVRARFPNELRSALDKAVATSRPV